LRRTSPRERVVRRGDTLTGLLQEEYGRVDQQLIDTVKQTNPQIVNPDVILRGSTIVLPEVPEGSQ
jgi:phage tail protein X